MGRWLLAILVIAPACVQAELVICDDGLACPVGTVCDPAHHSCAEPDQFTSCEGAADLALCLTNGACHEGVCLPIACGNARLDPDEACDDGNLVPNDGCASDCRSAETCGNGTLDLLLGEQCDDTNLRTHDGCDSRCRSEQRAWTDVSPSNPPYALDPAAAYDEVRERVVVFGGTDPSFRTLETTWEWDRRGWTKRNAFGPSARSGAAMVYDAARDRVILFGGYDGSKSLADTWTWDGTQWTQLFPPRSPPPVAFAPLVYDGARQVAVLFGGLSTGLMTSAQTWQWDGTTWTDVTPAGVSPPRRYKHAMAYDPILDRIVLHGGLAALSMNLLGDTWIWDGAAWMQSSAVVSARCQHAMSFDRKKRALILAGGNGGNDVWTFTGTAWMPLGSLSLPRLQHTQVHDGVQTLMLGGQGFGPPLSGPLAFYSACNCWGGISALYGVPSGEFAATYDPFRGRVMAFGGRDPNNLPANALWEISGLHGAGIGVLPSVPRTGSAIAYDTRRKRTLVVGGFDDAAIPLQEAWEWDGAAWLRVTDLPSPLAFPAAAFDPVRGVTVVYDGASTYEWDGTTWVSGGLTTAPPARQQPAMAYDVRRQRIVMFSGLERYFMGQPVTRTDTWEYDGEWHEVITEGSPPGRFAHSMAYDPQRGETILFGGSRGAYLDDTWRFDGTRWSRVLAAGTPPARFQSGLVHDALEHALVVVGGVGAAPLADAWQLRWDGGTDEACRLVIDRDKDGLSGCTDPDCWERCTPLCPPETSCAPGGPSCGDAICDPLETCRTCATDCGACLAVCGDSHCDPPETIADCPGDCTP